MRVCARAVLCLCVVRACMRVQMKAHIAQAEPWLEDPARFALMQTNVYLYFGSLYCIVVIFQLFDGAKGARFAGGEGEREDEF